MSHNHEVKDTDVHYKIDGVTRTIVNVDETKRMLVQGDHNSERLTFEIPRFFDGHDFSECNLVQVHYINTDMLEKEGSSGIYNVDDLRVSENEDIVLLSWLVPFGATKFVGMLNFSIRFVCIDDDGIIDYAWNTTTFKGIEIKPGVYNSDEIVEQYIDIIAKHEKKINALETKDKDMEANGVMFIDKMSGKKYNVYVSNGKLMMEGDE